MQTNRFKAALAISYVVIVGAVAGIIGFTSMSAWLAYAALTVVPLVVVAIYWRDPARTMSESIQAARR